MLSTQLKTQRTLAKLTQVELAAASDVPQPTISAIESGTTTDPRRSTIDRLAGALAKKPSDKPHVLATLMN